MELLLFFSLLPIFFSLFHLVTASRHGVLWAGEVGDVRIPLVPPRYLDEMGVFSVPLLSQGHGIQEAHRTERQEQAGNVARLAHH